MILQAFSIRHPTLEHFLRHSTLFTYHVLTHPLVIPLAIGLLVGSSMIGFIHELPGQARILSYFVSLVAIVIIFRRKLPSAFIFAIMALSLGFGIGLEHSWISAKRLLSPPQELFEDSHTIKGYVSSRLSQEPKSTKFYLKVSELCNKEEACRATQLNLSLYWPNPNQVLRQGDYLSLQAKVKKPYGLSNPGGYSKEKSFFLNELAGQGRVIQLTVLKESSSIPLRQKIADKISEVFADSEYKGLFLALIVGEQSYILDKQWEVFRNTGTSHLMAISGLHIGLVAGLMFMAFFKIWVRTPWVREVPAQNFAAMGAIFGALMYAHLAGWSIPTQRACIMVITFMLALLLKRKTPKFQVLSLALSMVLLFDPFAVFRPGLWLSFGAVFILLLVTNLPGNQSKLKQWLTPQLGIFVGMLPLTLFWFEQAAIISPIANLIAIPWMSFTVVPLALLGSLLSFSKVGHILLYISECLFKGLMEILQLLASWFGSFEVHLTTPVLLLALVGAGLCMMPKGFRWKYLSLICFVPLFAPHSNGLKKGELNLHVLDVGQGTAVVIELQNHTMIYDFGPKTPYGFDAGKVVINPFLRYLGIKDIDLAMISHADKDHYGGFDSVQAKYPIQEVMTSNPKLFKADSLCRQGQSWSWDGVNFEILHPSHELPIKKNNQSCVLKISTQDKHILITGDIEQIVEQSLVQSHLEQLKADILVVPHHGSRSSSSQAFIQAVNPEYAVITAGYQNPYHLPNAQIVDRYVKNNVKIHHSYETGAMRFTLENSLIKPHFNRVNQKGVWINRL